MSFILVDGKQIYYEEYGEKGKQTLVYLHGGPGENCLTYTHQAKILGEKFHVISFDQYGVFRSDAIPEEQRAGVMYHVKLIEQMRITLGIGSWIPIGHSFGGMLALVYAHTYPDSIDAVIYDCPMWSTLHTAKAIAKATIPYFEQNGMTEQAALCNEILQNNVSPKDAFEKALQIDMNDGVNEYCHVIKMSDYHKYINEHIPEPNVADDCWGKYIPFTQKLRDENDFYENYLPLIEKIIKPQMLMVGEYDMTCGKYEQAYFREHSSNGKFEMLKDCAHLTWFEQPEKYTRLITDFIHEQTKMRN